MKKIYKIIAIIILVLLIILSPLIVLFIIHQHQPTQCSVCNINGRKYPCHINLLDAYNNCFHKAIAECQNETSIIKKGNCIQQSHVQNKIAQCGKTPFEGGSGCGKGKTLTEKPVFANHCSFCK